ncbi:hypothetical protein GTA08_BOTSDO00418 [Botryosphaeria dothidea]|uniref:Uncharacterized protein n=1 Tax=Botryosphaeria dothidea TaxID=55169 RepID=A0A8H4N9X1_9PEZI|nr:hypothetical protein GTA08_BOTSDO00418 [Botryosphaeria dothidea]
MEEKERDACHPSTLVHGFHLGPETCITVTESNLAHSTSPTSPKATAHSHPQPFQQPHAQAFDLTNYNLMDRVCAFHGVYEDVHLLVKQNCYPRAICLGDISGSTMHDLFRQPTLPSRIERQKLQAHLRETLELLHKAGKSPRRRSRSRSIYTSLGWYKLIAKDYAALNGIFAHADSREAVKEINALLKQVSQEYLASYDQDLAELLFRVCTEDVESPMLQAIDTDIRMPYPELSLALAGHFKAAKYHTAALSNLYAALFRLDAILGAPELSEKRHNTYSELFCRMLIMAARCAGYIENKNPEHILDPPASLLFEKATSFTHSLKRNDASNVTLMGIQLEHASHILGNAALRMVRDMAPGLAEMVTSLMKSGIEDEWNESKSASIKLLERLEDLLGNIMYDGLEDADERLQEEVDNVNELLWAKGVMGRGIVAA